MFTKAILESPGDAVADVFDGAMVCVGGFGPVRNRPVTLCTALASRPEVRNLTIVSNGFPHQPLAENRQAKKFIGAFGGSVYRRAAASEEQICRLRTAGPTTVTEARAARPDGGSCLSLPSRQSVPGLRLRAEAWSP